VQYGGEIGQSGAYRVFQNYSNTGNLTLPNGQGAADGWHMFHTGFRSDWTLSPHDTMTVQGDFMQTGEGQTISVVFANALPLMRTFNDSVTTGAGNFLARWNHTLSNGSTMSLQVYYDRYDRHDEGVHEGLDTFDFDFQHHWRVGERNDVVWGVTAPPATVTLRDMGRLTCRSARRTISSASSFKTRSGSHNPCRLPWARNWSTNPTSGFNSNPVRG